MLSQFSHARPLEAITLATGPVLNVPRGGEIYAEGNAADTLLKVLAGTVRSCTFKRDGRRQIDAFYVRDDVFGFETGVLHSHSAEAVTDCSLVAYRRRDIAIFAASHRPFADQLYAYAVLSLLRAQEHTRILGHASAAEKLAAFLIECSERSLKKDCVLLGMSRIDIADYLGLTEETVSRGLTQLKRHCFIELPSARQVRIVDLARLRAIYA